MPPTLARLVELPADGQPGFPVAAKSPHARTMRHEESLAAGFDVKLDESLAVLAEQQIPEDGEVDVEHRDVGHRSAVAGHQAVREAEVCEESSQLLVDGDRPVPRTFSRHRRGPFLTAGPDIWAPDQGSETARYPNASSVG